MILIPGGYMFITEMKADAKQSQIEKLAIRELGQGCLNWNQNVGLDKYLEFTTNLSLDDNSRIYMDADSLRHFKKASKSAIWLADLEELASTMYSYNGFNPAVTINSAFGARVSTIVSYNINLISKIREKNETPLR